MLEVYFLRCRRFIALGVIWAMTFLGSPNAYSKTTIDNNGDCNANVSGSGNTVIVKCAPGEKSSQADHLIIVTSDAMNVVDFPNINPSMINPFLSTYSVDIDDEEVISSPLNTPFEDATLHKSDGDYSFKMELDFVFVNGFQAQAHCSGILKVHASAALIPRMLVLANPAGRVAAQTCRFDIRP
ncbi:hypothetical protein C8D77_107160 [Mesorhizobium loti]|uniref:Uncharacterized protein n=1 Tax=Rhizobium loti TaxID=381 RepID=A0A8E2W9R1_RHILI|nr:hypothetical protein C8D77_107160 [Mesorhizobium loti]